MRVLFLANDGEGLYKFRRELLETLIKEHEVFVSLPVDQYYENIKALGCTFIKTEFERKGTNPVKDIKLLNTYRSILKEVKPDIVFTYTIKPNVYGGMACQIEKVPYLTNITGLGSALENPGALQPLVITLYKMGLRKAQKVFFQNETNKDFMLEKGIVKGRYEVIPGSGVNLTQYPLLEYPSEETIDFVYVGRMMAEKGFSQYLVCAKEIHQKYPQTRFHVCGAYEDDYHKEVEELSKDGTLIYHGSVKNMKEIYEKIHCLIHPTYYPEGLSNVLLEASACGRPLITTNRAGCKEVIDEGKNGYLVKQKDEIDLIEKVEKFLSLSSEERKQMGLYGRKKVEKEFDRNLVIAAYLREISK